MQANLKIRRFDPEQNGGKAWYQSYSVEVADYGSVLDALLIVRDEIDGTLGVRCSCRSAICGSCAMRINGHARLACKTRVCHVAPKGEEIVVEPGGNLPVVKDLVVDMQPFWGKIRAVDPWLQPGPEKPQRENLVPHERMAALQQTMNCIMCGCCLMDCTSLQAQLNQGKPYAETFLGPAALAKAQRFVGDPRDAATLQRLEELTQPTGIWECTHCFECVEVCPKGVAPLEQITKLRKVAEESGFTDHNGVRHSVAFAQSVEHGGLLDEGYLARKSVTFGELFTMIPGALRMWWAGKMPPLFHKPIPGVEHVQRIFKAIQAEGKTTVEAPQKSTAELKAEVELRPATAASPRAQLTGEKRIT